jgi:hypothetical protein
MRSLALLSVVAAVAGSASASPVSWSVVTIPARSHILGGPWALSQATTGDPHAGYPTPNPGLSVFAPYYQAYTFGDDLILQGYFDYRPKDLTEGIVAARSWDGGLTWYFQEEALQLAQTDPNAMPSDDGEGHPFVLAVDGHVYLYTLDRSADAVDNLGLLVSEISPNARHPLRGAPAVGAPGRDSLRTIGLEAPDGILDVVSASDHRVRALYLRKHLGKKPAPDTTTLVLVESSDGIHWENPVETTGLTETTAPFVGPRGTVVQYDDGHYGLFYSGGLAGEDSDAFHFIGYAESDDLVSWQVIQGADAPLLSIDPEKDPTGVQDWYAGRIYAPSVTFGPDGCTATMMVSGYHAEKVKDSPADYRQMGVVTLSACDADASGKADRPTGNASNGSSAAGCSAGGTTHQGALGVVLVLLCLCLLRRRA